VDLLFSNPDGLHDAVGPIDEKESTSDRLERELIIEVFRSELPKGDCLELREVIQRIGDVSDASEALARRLDILSLKRQV
jgi:uncharacterized protein Yka (UPF0111/DUF47 family)